MNIALAIFKFLVVEFAKSVAITTASLAMLLLFGLAYTYNEDRKSARAAKKSARTK